MPEEILLRYKTELELKKRLKTNAPLVLINQYRTRLENYLDAGHGEYWLRDLRIPSLIVKMFQNHNRQWYDLDAYTIMPNHVHVLFTLNGDKSLSEIIGNWKGGSAFSANRILNRVGRSGSANISTESSRVNDNANLLFAIFSGIL